MLIVRNQTFLAGVALLLFVGVSAQAENIEVGTRLELFADDYLIEKMTGDLKQQVQRPVPKEVSLTTDAPWEGNTSAYYTVFRDTDRFRMYYRGSHFDETTRRSAHPEVTCYAESKDGIHWTKPNLGLVEFNGSTKNNIVLSGIGVHCFAAFKDANPNCPPEAKYKGMSRGRPTGKKGLYVFQSPDGIHWKKIKNEPVITEGAFDSQNLAFWDPHSNQYREYHRTFVDRKRAIMTGTSNDFVNWSKPKLLKYGDTPAEHLYTNAVQVYQRAPHLLIGFPTRYLPSEGQRVEPTFMISRDGMQFKRWLEPVIPESAPKDRSGNRSNYMAWGLVEIPGRPNHLSVYASEAYYTGPDSRLRRFEYRKDGFVSVNAGKQGGELVTKPFVLDKQAHDLVINFKTTDDGRVRVALETKDGTAIAGRGLADCKTITGDAIAQQVQWKQPWKDLAGKVVRLRFELTNADLYSCQFQPKRK